MNKGDSRELSIAGFASQQKAQASAADVGTHPWLHICVEHLIDNDSFFSRLYDKPRTTLSAAELNLVLRATTRALQTGAVRPESLTKLMLEGTSFDYSILFNELLPLMSHVTDINLARSSLDDSAAAGLVRALHPSAALSRVVLAHTHVSDAGLFALVSKLQ